VKSKNIYGRSQRQKRSKSNELIIYLFHPSFFVNKKTLIFMIFLKKSYFTDPFLKTLENQMGRFSSKSANLPPFFQSVSKLTLRNSALVQSSPAPVALTPFIIFF
jgi:hypothetical protein